MMGEHKESMLVRVERRLAGEERNDLLDVTFAFSGAPTKDEIDEFNTWLREKFCRKRMNDLMSGEPTNGAIAHMLEGVGALFFWGDAELLAVDVESK